MIGNRTNAIRALIAVSAVLIALPCSAELPGQIKVNPASPEWLERPDGTPFFMCGPGDPEWFLYLGSRQPDGTRSGGGQDQKIQRLIDQGGNAIYMEAVRSHGGDGPADHNPFVDSDPAMGLDEDILSQWDVWLAQMDAGGITIFFLLFDDSACVWDCNKSSDHAVPAEEQSLIEALVNRFEGYDNVIWLPAEEYSEAFSVQRTSNQAAVIRAADDHDHPIGTTQHSGMVFDHPDDPNIDVFGIQCQEVNGPSCSDTTTPAQVNESMNVAWDNAAGRYNITLAEIRYAGTGTGDRARHLMWAAAMGGAYFLVQGWNLTGPGDPPDSNLNECRYLRSFLESVPLQDMEPDNTRGQADTDYVLVDDAIPTYVLYTDAYSSGMGINGLPPGPYSLEWLDTVSGATLQESHDQTASGPATFVRPAALGSAAELALFLEHGCGSSGGDPDGDSVCSSVDNCPQLSNPDQADGDEDGVGDVCDNCLSDWNPDQADGDEDDVGDVCDPCPADALNDIDGDNVCGDLDNCPTVWNPDQTDTDGDGVGDACMLTGVYLNEVHYHEDVGEQEFIELYAAEGPVDMTGWSISDQDQETFVFDSGDPRFPCGEPFVMEPGDRLLLWHGPGTSVCTGAVREIYLASALFLQREGDDVVLKASDDTCRDYMAFEGGSAINGAPADCVWTGSNPNNSDIGGTSVSRFDSAPFNDTDSGLDWERSGRTTTNGPKSPGGWNETPVDTDLDGLTDGVDNCPSFWNPPQSDFDDDGEGDHCDLDDGLIYVRFDGPGRVEWQAEQGFTAWNAYRGDLDVLRSTGVYTQEPGSNTLALRDCNLLDRWMDDPDPPASGKCALFLATGMSSGVESDLGKDGAGIPRQNHNACP